MADKDDERAALVGDLTAAELEGLAELDAQLEGGGDAGDVFDPEKVYKGKNTTDEQDAEEQRQIEQRAADDAAVQKAEQVAAAAKAADAEAKAAPESDPAKAAADAKAAAEPEPEPEPAPTSAPLWIVEAPENAEQLLKDIADKKEALYTQLDDGDITGKEMGVALEALNKEERSIERQVARAEDARAMEEQRQTNERMGEINVFLASVGIPHDPKNLKFKTLDAAVRDIASKPENATASPTKIMQLSYDYCVAEGVLPKIEKAAPSEKKEKAPKVLDVVPTLAKVPAAESNDTDANQFAWLNRISDPDKREAAYSKLTPAQQEAYLAYGN